MTENEELKLHNKSDKPDNVAQRESEVIDEYENIQAELPKWLRSFYMYLNQHNLPLTRLSYLRDIKFFFNYLLENSDIGKHAETAADITLEDIDSITGNDVNLFLDHCRRYKVTVDKITTVYENQNAALSHKKSSLSVLFKCLYRDGLIHNNITDTFNPIRLPKPGEREIKALQDDEVMKMLDAVSEGTGLTKKEYEYWLKTKYRDRLILLMFVTYGLRLSELQMLNISSFNFDRGEFKIYRKRSKESFMPINHTIEDAFNEYISLERADENTLAEENKDALFLSLQGTRLTDRQIRQIVKKYTSISLGTSRESGYSPHKLRATAATSLIGRGASIYDVQDLLDHDNVSTTQLYAKHKEQTKKQLIKNFEWDDDK